MCEIISTYSLLNARISNSCSNEFTIKVLHILCAMSYLFLMAFSHNPVNFSKSLVTGSLVKEKAGWWIKCRDAEDEDCCERRRRRRRKRWWEGHRSLAREALQQRPGAIHHPNNCFPSYHSSYRTLLILRTAHHRVLYRILSQKHFLLYAITLQNIPLRAELRKAEALAILKHCLCANVRTYVRTCVHAHIFIKSLVIKR